MSWIAQSWSALKTACTCRNFGYILFLFTFCLIALEIGARWYLGSVLEKSSNRKFQFDSYRIYSHVPGFTEGNDEANWIEINDQGFRRSQNVEKVKPDNTYRVFLMGGSAAHGISSSAPYPVVHIYNDQTIDAYLERMLTAKYPDRNFEIINAAVTGYHVFQHTAYLLAELLDYDPDLIIFMDGVNDHYMYNEQYDYFYDNPYQFWSSRLTAPSFEGLLDYTSLWASNFSALARGYYAWDLQQDAHKNRAKASNLIGDLSDEEKESGYLRIRKKQYYRSIEANLFLLEHWGIDAIICLQPSLILREESMLTSDEKSLMKWLTHQDWQLLYPYIAGDLDTISRNHGVGFIDFVPLFNSTELKGEALFIDYCHLTVRANEEAANAMLPYVEKAMEKHVTVAEDFMLSENRTDSLSDL